jgi:hypothetical protein
MLTRDDVVRIARTLIEDELRIEIRDTGNVYDRCIEIYLGNKLISSIIIDVYSE